MTTTMTPGTTDRGQLMLGEMGEQPAVLAALVDRFADLRGQVHAAAAAGAGRRGVAFLARGSSDHAALLGRYAVELYAGRPTSLMAPSLVTAYHRRPDQYDGWLVVAFSQSGRTPEIVDVARQCADAGAVLVAITNDAESDLSQIAHLTIDLAAGPERAVPATKTVTAQMLAALVVASGVADLGAGLHERDVAEIPGAVAEILADAAPVQRISSELAGHDRMAIVGRGYCYPAALETALKLQETSGIMAHGFSTADFRHGPIAVTGSDAPAVLLAGSGPTDDDTRALVADLQVREARSTVLGTGAEVSAGWAALGHAGECVLATVRGQQLAYGVAAARGLDPDRPAGLHKVTLTH